VPHALAITQEPPKAELLQCLVTVSGLPCDDLPVGGLDATPPPHQTVHHVCCEGLARACLTGLEDVYRLTKGRHFVEEVRICAHVEQLATVLEYQRELPSQDVPPRVTGWAPTAPRGRPGQFVTLQPSAGDAWLKLQAVDEGARVHLDLDTSDRSTAVERSIELGARPAGRYGEVEAVRSPGGLLFCHRREEPSRRFARADPDSVLDQVCLDVPTTLWDQELAFWTG